MYRDSANLVILISASSRSTKSQDNFSNPGIAATAQHSPKKTREQKEAADKKLRTSLDSRFAFQGLFCLERGARPQT
eukprot:981931-Amphidinium_carterae.1